MFLVIINVNHSFSLPFERLRAILNGHEGEFDNLRFPCFCGLPQKIFKACNKGQVGLYYTAKDTLKMFIVISNVYDECLLIVVKGGIQFSVLYVVLFVKILKGYYTNFLVRNMFNELFESTLFFM